MKSGDLARLFGVSSETIRNWSQVFQEYLSESKTKQRIYTDDDVIVLATVAKYSHAGHNLRSIQERLAAGERVEHPGVATFGVDGRMIPAAAVEQLVDATEMRIELEQTKLERDKALEMLQAAQARLEKMEQEQRARDEAHRQEIKLLQEKIAELRERVGRAEGEIAYRRELEKKLKSNETDN